MHYALALAHTAALDVCLLYSHAERQYYDTASFGSAPGIQDMLIWAAARTASVGVRHDVMLTSGQAITTVAETIAATATERACDVIVLGIESRWSWQRLVHRYMARAVLANTTLPVLLVRRSITYAY